MKSSHPDVVEPLFMVNQCALRTGTSLEDVTWDDMVEELGD